MQEEWGHEVAAEALPAEEGVAIEGEVLEAVPIYAEEGMKEMISQEEEAPGTVVFEYREDDGGRWHPYDEATCQRLEHASRQGDARVSLPGRRRYTAIGLGEENEDGMILGDSRFTASSEFSGNCTVATGRLNKPGARWAPTSNDMHAGTSWMQVKLPGARLIGRIATQGNGSYQEWTTAYRVKHSMDGETWVDYAQKLDGNADQHTVVTHDFEPQFECKFVRVVPTSWQRHACLRIELYQTSAEPEETEVRFGVPAWESPTGIAETNPADGSTRVVRRVVRDPGVAVLDKDNGGFRWGSRVRGELINISADGLTATDIAPNPHHNGRYRVVAAERGYSSGEHVIRLKVLKRGRFLFGLATGDVQSNWHEGNGKSLHQVNCAWTICVPSQGLGGNGFNRWHANCSTNTGLPWPDHPEGQVITMKFNCDAGTVGFAVNGRKGGGFGGLPRGTALFPVVSFGGDGSAGCSVQIEPGPHAGVDLRPNSASFQSAAPFRHIIHTAEFWVKVPSWTSARVGILMGQGYPYADRRSLHHAINFEIHERGRPRIWWNSGEVDWKCGDIDLRTGKWTHLAFVIHEAMDAATVFVDGEEISTTRTRFARVVATRPPRFGGDERAGNGIGNVPPQFQLRAVRVWSVARTQQQLQRYATAALCLGDGLMLHYYLDAAKHADGCIVDDSPSGNNARIVGGRRLYWLNGDWPPPPPPPCCTMM